MLIVQIALAIIFASMFERLDVPWFKAVKMIRIVLPIFAVNAPNSQFYWVSAIQCWPHESNG